MVGKTEIDTAGEFPPAMERRQHFDIAVVGGGIAGHWTAKQLADNGFLNVLLISGEQPRQKSLFAQGAVLAKHELYNPLQENEENGYQLYPIADYWMDYPDQQEVLKTPEFDEFANPANAYYALENAGLIEAIKADSRYLTYDRGVTRIELRDGQVILDINQEQQIIVEVVIDATGGASPLSRSLIFNKSGEHIPLVDDDPIIMWCHGERAITAVDRPHTLYHPAGSEIGTASWILPWGEDEADIIAAGFTRLSTLKNIPRQDIYDAFVKYSQAQGYIGEIKDGEAINGFIRIQPILPKSAELDNIFIVGDAAGVGSPVYGEVISAVLAYGAPLADIIKSGKTPRDYYKYWRHHQSQFPYDLEQALLKMKVEPLGKKQNNNWRIEEGAGSNISLYKAILGNLSPAAQKEFLLTRKLPKTMLPFAALSLIQEPQIRRYLFDFARHYAYVKKCELQGRMP